MSATGAVILKSALAQLLDFAITAAVSKLGRDAVVNNTDKWRSEENLDEAQILERLKELAKSSEDAAQGSVDRMPPDA